MSRDPSIRSRSSSKSEKSVNANADLFSDTILTFSHGYGGLGHTYYEKLGENITKIHQVDIINNITETRGSVRGRAIQLALEMKQQEVVEKDIIVICSGNNAHQTIVVLATLFLGAIVAPLDPLFNQRELERLLKKLRPKIIFGDSRSISAIEHVFNMSSLTAKIVSFDPSDSTTSFFKLFQHSEDELFKPVFVEDPTNTVAFILPTQGTTDDPKLVCITHQNMWLQTSIFTDIFGTLDKVMSFFTLSYHLHTILICSSFENELTIIIPGPFVERTACKYIQDFHITEALLGTEYAVKMFGHVASRDYNLKCLKAVLIGCTHTTSTELKMFRRSMPRIKFLNCYCMAEVGIVSATKSDQYNEALKRVDSTGTLMRNCKIRIIDINTKQPVGANYLGEIYYKGDGLMAGYYRSKIKTSDICERGFFKTGDIGIYDESGWLYYKIRIEDLIVTDTNTFIPCDLEEVIMTHPDVVDAVVIGSKKDIIAVVKNAHEDLTPEILSRYIRERILVEQRPTEIVFIASYPKTSIGNVKRRLLRAKYLSSGIKRVESLASLSTMI